MRAISRLRLDDFTGCFEPLGLALKPQPEQVALDFLEQEIELFVGLLAKLAGLGHRCSLLKPSAVGARIGS